MDPLSASASLIAVITACLQTTTLLSAAVLRYKGRDKTLNRLYGGLQDLINILQSLEKVKSTDGITKMLIEGPVARCHQVCQDFQAAMEKFNSKSRLGFVDWAKMEFMASDINDFMDTLASYKSTIAIGLGVITMQKSTLDQKVVDAFTEMIHNTTYDLKLHLQRVEERLEQEGRHKKGSSITVTADLKDEKDVTNHCLSICEKAKTYIESLQEQQPKDKTVADHIKEQYAAQLLTNQTLNVSRDELVKTIASLQKQLDKMVGKKGVEHDHEHDLSQLLKDISVSKQCLEVCEQASDQVSRLKIHNIGPVIAEHNTDQVVVTTLADLFNVERVEAKSDSAQLVGSMEDQSLRQLSSDRYGSRFGAVNARVLPTQERTSPSAATNITQSSRSGPSDQILRVVADGSGRKSASDKPAANEMRRRGTGNDAPL